MAPRKKAKAKPFRTISKRKAKDAAMTAQSEASASSPTMTGTTMDDGRDDMDRSNNVREVGGNEDIGVEVSAIEENANGEGLVQGGVVIATETMNNEEHDKEEVGDEENGNEKCFVQDFDNIEMEAMDCDVYANKVGIDKEIEVESLNTHNEVNEWVVTPTEETEVEVLAVENVSGGCLGEVDATVTDVNDENTPYKENFGEYANEDRITGNIANEEDEDDEEEDDEEEDEDDEEEDEDDEEEDEEEEEEEDDDEDREEENDLTDEVEELNDQIDEMDDKHLEEDIHGNVLIVFNKNGDEEDVVGKGNCQGIDNGNKNVVGEVNSEGVEKEQKKDEVVNMTKKKIIRSRKRIRTSTTLAGSASNLVLNENTLGQGVNEDLKEHKNSEDVPNIEDDKNNVAYGNKGKQKDGVHVKDSGGEKVQVNTEKEAGESSMKKRKRPKQKGRSSFLVKESLEKIASETGGKSGLSNKKNGLLKSETKGMIFICSSKTKSDCYRYMVLGLPARKREMVENIFKGMALFLYDVDKKLLYGIYQAAAHGGYELEPEAFNSKFPAQVRFESLEDCLPLEEKKFSKVIRDNYYTRNKFDCQLNSVQVENLCKLFRASMKDVKSERLTSRADRGSRNAREREREKRKVKAAPARIVSERRKARLPPARKERRHRERPLVHNEVASLPRRPVRLSQATSSSYAYARTLTREVYRGEPPVPHSEIYRRQQGDPYRRELLLERRDTYSPDPYMEHSGTYRHEPVLVPRDLYRVEQPPLRPRDSYLQYPVLERRDYDLEPLVQRRDYDLEPLAEHRDYEPLPSRRDPYRHPSPLLDHQDFYREDPVLERQNLQRLNLEARHPNRRGREDALSRQDHLAYSGGVYSIAEPLRPAMVPNTVYLSSAEAEPPRYYSRRPVYRL